MNLIKDSNSFCRETEAYKAHESLMATASSPICRLQLSSQETSPFKSFFSNASPLQDYSQRFSETLEVFNRLAADSNRRTEKKLRLSEYIKQKELESVKRYKENEQVYQRLLDDTQQRREKQEVKEKCRVQILETTIKSFRTEKTCTKEEAEAIVKRLLSKNYSDSPRKIVEQEYSYNKQRDLHRFLSADALKSKEKVDKNEKSPVKIKCDMDIVERTEIEQRYGKPGLPPNLEERKKIVIRKVKTTGESDGLSKGIKKGGQSQRVLVSPRGKYEVKRGSENCWQMALVRQKK